MTMMSMMMTTMTWLVVGVAPAVTTVQPELEETTPFTSPTDQGLLRMVQSLVKQTADISRKQTREWSRLRRLERRSKSTRHDFDVMHADVTELKQHVSEVNSRLDSLDHLTAHLRVTFNRLSRDQQQLGEDLGKLRHSQHVTGKRLDTVERNLTSLGIGVSSSRSAIRHLEVAHRQATESQQHVVHKLSSLEMKVSRHTAKHLSSQARSAHKREFLNDGIFLSNPDQSSRTPTKSEMLSDTDHETTEADMAVIISGDGETATELVAGSGDGEEFFIVEEKYGDDGGSGHVEEGVLDAVTVFREREVVSPTPLTTNPIPTLTQASFSIPTSPPIITTCPSADDYHLLKQRVEKVEDRLDSTASVEEAFQAVITNETERLDAALAKRDETLAHVQGNLADLGITVSRLAGHMASLRLTEFVDRLQSSLVNFTANVLTLDQWQVASQQIMNSTQKTRKLIADLARDVTDNAQMTSDLQMTQRESRALSERQYRLLQTHVIRLNNSLQDLQEGFTSLATDNHKQRHQQHHHHRGQRPNTAPTSPSGSANSGHQHQSASVVSSRVDDLALQMVYSDNRLSHLETRLLNASLLACQKSNTDLYQDTKLLSMDQSLVDVQQGIAVLKDTVKRLDLDLYRLHGNSKANQEGVRKVKGQVKDMVKVTSAIHLLRKEMDNLLFQLPVDCQDYYVRGHRQSGEYVIYPRRAPHSIKVYCIMHSAHTSHGVLNDSSATATTNTNNNNNNNSSSNSSRSDGDEDDSMKKTMYDDEEKKPDDEEELFEEGGWTVVQQRVSGKVNFTRNWAEYAEGFGSPVSELWVGNDNLHLLTRHRNYTLLLHMTDILGGYWTARYSTFSVSGKADNYRLSLGRFLGNATDSLSYSSGASFSTYDRDNDSSSSPCARYNGGGWWYSHCQISNLNGPYDVGIIWFQRRWRDWLQLRKVRMMIRPVS